MTDINDQIEKIEKEIRKTPYHKATEHHIGRLRAKLSKLKEKQFEASAKKGSGVGYAVKKQGDATIVLVGPPSAGKSTLLNKLTNAKSKIAPYEFTTVSVIPGMMVYKSANIQILDVPGLIKGAEEGKGRGREVLSVARAADLLVLITEVKKENFLTRIEKILERNGIRINKEPANVTVDKKVSGGIVIHSNIDQNLSKETIKDIASELGIKNAEINIKEKLTIESLIDAFSKNRVYVPAIKVVNKLDLAKKDKDKKGVIYISAKENKNTDKLKRAIFQKLALLRVYLVKTYERPNFENPIVIKKDTDLQSLAEKIGEEFAQSKTKAKIWGNGAKFPGQEVSLKTQAQDGMQIRFI